MHHTQLRRVARRWTVVGIALASLALGGCGSDKAAEKKAAPATLEKVEKGQIGKITLTEQAAKRLDIQTGQVEASTGTPLKVPYNAVIYQPDGTTWVYANPATLVYKRESITIDRIEKDSALLTAGPPAGTKVVTVGASELWGFEFGVGK